MTGLLGQTGIGVQFARRVQESPAPGVPYRESFDPDGPTWIFNPATLQWMAENYPAVGVIGAYSSAVLQRAIVDRPGQVPGGK